MEGLKQRLDITRSALLGKHSGKPHIRECLFPEEEWRTRGEAHTAKSNCVCFTPFNPYWVHTCFLHYLYFGGWLNYFHYLEVH